MRAFWGTLCALTLRHSIALWVRIFDWRREAEERMRAKGKPGMTDEQVKDFVSRFIPSYEEYLKDLYTKGASDRIPQLNIKINHKRVPIE